MLIICHKIAYLYVVHVVNFLFQLISISPLFLGTAMYANEFKTKEKQQFINGVQKKNQFYSLPFGQAVASMY